MERSAPVEGSLRRARLTGSLTAEERRAAAAAQVPSRARQRRYLAKLSTAVRKSELLGRISAQRAAG